MFPGDEQVFDAAKWPALFAEVHYGFRPGGTNSRQLLKFFEGGGVQVKRFSREAASCPAPPPQTQAQSRESWRLCRGTDLSGSRLPCFLAAPNFLDLLASSPSLASSARFASLEPVPCASNTSNSPIARPARSSSLRSATRTIRAFASRNTCRCGEPSSAVSARIFSR